MVFIMAILRSKEARALGDEELDGKLQQVRTEFAREKGTVASGMKAENPGKIREMRKTIARILTIQSERKRKTAKPASVQASVASVKTKTENRVNQKSKATIKPKQAAAKPKKTAKIEKDN